MIAALVNQKGSVGKTTLALHLARGRDGQGTRAALIGADPQGSVLAREFPPPEGGTP